MTNFLGCLIIDIENKELSQEDKELLAHPLIGGVILFTRNYESQHQLSNLCSAIRAVRSTPLLIMVDQEGGRVQRFKKDFTPLPPMAALGKLYDEHPASALTLAKDCGWLMASELLFSGVDLSLAPVLDLNKGVSQVIGERAFHANSEVVIKLAKAFSTGMKEAGMAATGKHFPGHGSVVSDSHTALPVDLRKLSEIERDDMIPFAGMIQAGISAIMAAHIVFPTVDQVPVGFSRFWLQEVLRTQLQFKGVIFSDDLTMEGANISSNFADRVDAARTAGCDFTLLCNHRLAVIQVIDDLAYSSYQVSEKTWYKLKGNFSSTQQSYKDDVRWQKTHHFLMTNVFHNNNR